MEAATSAEKGSSDEKRPAATRRDRLLRAPVRGGLRIEQQLQHDQLHDREHQSASSGGLKTNTTPKYAAPAASAPVQSGTVQIAYRNIAIDPDTVKVKVGSTIKWTDYDDVTHNVTSESGPSNFASANLNEGSTFSYKVTKPGVIHYECTYHPASMNGTIEVVK